MDEHDGNRDLRYAAMYRGVVVDNADPLKIGRIKFRVPGLIEPTSGWALPMRGLAHSFDVPDVDAEVVVWFHQGDVDQPQYLPGNPHAPQGASEVNERATRKDVADVHLVKLIETDRWLVILDDSEDTPAMILRDKVSGDGFDYNGLARVLTITGTSLVNINSTGRVVIDALGCSIMGREVLPNGEPI